ncbi:hypothetical protein GH714_027768 [Hevea brasiliensis]|uniref:DUF3741 domain-containing protein n=1 Tax=Hevea brasiliensis TaxID=3981 RepID=A0A6A6MLF5_HEVBR|nr:hypothetical protein GH714_027768 [Hevea brasiliensis]
MINYSSSVLKAPPHAPSYLRSSLFLKQQRTNPMKDLSFFLLKNSVASKMRKGIRNICNGDGSTSILNQKTSPPNNNSDFYNHTASTSAIPSPTLEEMILQLELEEEISRKVKLDHGMRGGRMSCVSSSDILRSARNAALNQYPRFSLDGRDAMYRSSFRKSSSSPSSGPNLLPQTLAGETVVWCKPGVVAKLMGLEAIPVPIIHFNSRERNSKETLSSIIKRQNLRRRVQRHEMERRVSSADHIRMHICDHLGRGRGRMGSCSNTTELPIDGGGWPTRRFRCKNSNLMMHN